MDFNELTSNKLFWVFVVMVALIGGVFLINTVVVNKVTDQVIERLQKDYSPGPYAPGFDPDKVNPGFWQPPSPPAEFQTGSKVWETEWEAQRENESLN